ncbi:unnamed protein product [Rhizophagus irregularis]|nr:unnamed protein product [Rhizophagus irregularis]
MYNSDFKETDYELDNSNNEEFKSELDGDEENDKSISEERITLLSTNQDDDESGTSEFNMLSRTRLFPRIVILNWNNQMLA